MEPALAASMLFAKHKADVAMAAAAKIMDINSSAGARLLESVSDSANELERVAAETVAGTGEFVDTFV